MYQSKFKRPLLALLVAFLSLSLTACSTVKEVQVPYPVREKPPTDLLATCPVPEVIAKKNGDLVNAIVALRDALAKCNIDKESLREWAKD